MTEIPAQLVLKSLKSPILLIGPDQRVAMQNSAMTATLKLDFTGRNYVTALRQPALLAAIEGARRNKTRQTARYILRDGEIDLTYEASAVQVDDHIVVMFEDKTAAKETDILRRDFVANVSHELRTPLTALLGFIETMQGPAQNDPAAQQRFLKIMATQADRLRRLVDDLLSLSRVEESERSRPTTLVDFKLIVGQSMDLLQPLANAAGTHIRMGVADDVPVVPGDEAQLQQVTNNLIENAIKYGATPDGITISIKSPAYETVLRQSCIRISIADCGVGIPAHHLVRLTERFYRVDSHRDREMGGTGLGLAIVKHILNRHRGRLFFESVEGKGTTATIVLPTNIVTSQ